MADNKDKPEGADKNTQIERKVRPTLFIGLGGTGKEILLRLRRRILQHDWAGGRISDIGRFPVASFIYFDLDMAEAVDLSKPTDHLTKATAFVENEKLQRKLDIRMYMNEIDTFPHIKEWLPQGDLASIDTEKGAGQVRSISRVQFFDQFAAFRGLVMSQGREVLAGVTHQEQLKQLGLDIEQDLRIVVVCSCAGGTGSGSFIDVGYMLRSLESPKPAEVDLVLLLPGGFEQAGKTRVNANTFAAMMELEHCMRPNAAPPYVTQWTLAEDRPIKDIVPYSEVFLVDTVNVMKAHTREVKNIYDMVADIMFEDFGSSDFSTAKRSIAVNQTRHKVEPYHPVVGAQKFVHSMAYSSFGQATIDTKGQAALDTAVSESCKTMLKIFFNVATGDSSKLPTTQERDKFLDEFFFLSRTSFEETLSGVADTAPINEFALVDELLKLSQGNETVISSISRKIDENFDNVTSTGDVANWPKLVRQLIEQCYEDVVGSLKNPDESGVQGKHVTAARAEFIRQLKGENGAESKVQAALFDYLDNRERGGLDFTISLVEEAKLRIGNDIQLLEEAENAYLARSEAVYDRFNASVANLTEAGQKHFLTGVDRKAAMMFIEHLRSETKYYVTMLLRQKACVEAISLLNDASAVLGSRIGLADDGETTLWDGLVGELVEGRLAIKATLASLDRDLSLVRSAADKASDGMYILLPGIDKEAAEILTPKLEEAEAWAVDAFRDIGGSRTVFPKLRKAQERDVLLNKLRAYVKNQLKPRSERLRSVQDVLLAMPAAARKKILEQAVTRAMPWVDANFDRIRGNGVTMRERYQVYVAVEDEEKFKRSGLAQELEDQLPAGQLEVNRIQFKSTKERDRIIIYCELSGIPLDCITPLRGDWRRDYRKEKNNGVLPLHNCKFENRYSSPIVPTPDEITQVQKQMSVFLRGVSLGVIMRANDTANSWYQIKKKMDILRVGSERDIKADGFSRTAEEVILDQLKKAEMSLVPLQLLALAVLLEWNAQYAYTSILEERGGGMRNEEIKCIAHMVALNLASQYEQRAQNIPGSSALTDIDGIKAALETTVNEWSLEIPGSVSDVDDKDVRRDGPAAAINKRRVNLEKFDAGTLEQIIAAKSAKPKPDAPADGMLHIDLAANNGTLYVVVEGAETGPHTEEEFRRIVQSGRVKPEDEAWCPQLTAWAQVKRIAEVAALLPAAAVTPPPRRPVPPPRG